MRTLAAITAVLLTASAMALDLKPYPNYDPRRLAVQPAAIPEADRAKLQTNLAELQKAIAEIAADKKLAPAMKELLPDVQVYANAVRYALEYDEILDAKHIKPAKELLLEGIERAKQLREGKPSWPAAKGLIPRGYVSRIDGSVQPYGMVVPASFEQEPARPRRLEIWLHGRGDNLTELAFLLDRRRSPGEFQFADAIVVHLYGRYCNAFKFAGETDCFEAILDIRRRYPIDENRIVLRGFSMGGAGCWHLAAHHPGFFAAASPGAGFTETAEYTNAFKDPKNPPPQHEQTLWHLYDSVDYAENFYNLPLVAYSGEVDKQKQAADKMATALAAEGLTMTHIIGAQMPHKYDAPSKVEINRRIDQIMLKGRERVPPRIRFTTYTLRYNQSHWVTIDGLEQHWQRARIDAQLAGPRRITVKTQNVTALTLNMPSGYCPFDNTKPPVVALDGADIEAPPVETDGSWQAHFRKDNGKWMRSETAGFTELSKKHGVQGPIDDAFMDSFIMVKPTGKALNDKVGAWAGMEMKRAIEQWRSIFRGEARSIDDAKVSDAEIAAHHLVLWGDPSSNAVLAKIADKLPIKWSSTGVEFGGQKFSADNHVPVFVYPNPLNPEKYVVINSGFTFREWPVSNAKQIPVLPDWVVVDINSPPTPRLPGAIVKAGFFDENWRLKD